MFFAKVILLLLRNCRRKTIHYFIRTRRKVSIYILNLWFFQIYLRKASILWIVLPFLNKSVLFCYFLVIFLFIFVIFLNLFFLLLLFFSNIYLRRIIKVTYFLKILILILRLFSIFLIKKNKKTNFKFLFTFSLIQLLLD